VVYEGVELMRIAAIVLVLAGVLAVAGLATAARVPAVYDNCTKFNKKYRHGVGRARAHDHTRGHHPVTTFRRSTRLYKAAVKWNRDLDRDRDGVACEKA
jgi:hypothetical protein